MNQPIDMQSAIFTELKALLAQVPNFGAEVIERGLRPSSLDIGANSGLPVSTVLV